MRKWVLWLTVGCLLLTAAPHGYARELDTATVSTGGGSLNLRKKATRKSDYILRIPDGATVDLLEAAGDWYMVSYEGQKGYVMADYLIPDPITENETANAPTNPVGTNLPSVGQGAADSPGITGGADDKSQAVNPASNTNPDALQNLDDATADDASITEAFTRTLNQIAILRGAQALKQGPDSASKTSANLLEDAEVTVRSIDGNWCYVICEAGTGYLPTASLRFTNREAESSDGSAASGDSPAAPDRQSAEQSPSRPSYEGMSQIAESEARAIADGVLRDKYDGFADGMSLTARLHTQESAYFETPYYQFDYYADGLLRYSCYIHAYTREILYLNESNAPDGSLG